MLTNNDITLIVCNFNGDIFLSNSLPLWVPLFPKIIIADACSTVTPHFPSVITVSGSIVGGKNNAVWAAVSLAVTKYVFIIDNDMHPPPGFDVQLLLEKLVSLKSPIFFPIFNIGEQSTKYYGVEFGLCFLKPRLYKTYEQIKLLEGPRDMYTGNICIERKLFLDLGGYSTILKFGGDDNLLSLKLKQHNIKLNLITFSYLLHVGLSNRTTTNSAKGWWHHVFIAHWCINNYWKPTYYRILSHICTFIYLTFSAIANVVKYRNQWYFFGYILGYIQLWKLRH